MEHKGTRPLRTERLILRPFTMDDLEAVYGNYGSDPAVQTFLSWAPCATREGTAAFLAMHESGYEREDFYGWAITLEGEVIGSVGIFDLEEDLAAGELGCSLGSRWWNRGLASEAVEAVLDFAFRQVGFHRIHASCQAENRGSGRVMEKCGMTREGIRRDGALARDGSYRDLLLYARLAGDPAPRTGNGAVPSESMMERIR